MFLKFNWCILSTEERRERWGCREVGKDQIILGNNRQS